MGMWDGHGFRGKAFKGAYEAYKLALAVYLYKAMKAAGSSIPDRYKPIINECTDLLAMLQ